MTSSGLHLSRQQFFPLIHSCNEINQATANPRSPILGFGSCGVASACWGNMTRVCRAHLWRQFHSQKCWGCLKFTTVVLSHHQDGQVRTCVTAEYFKSPATTSLKRLKKWNPIKVLAVIEQAPGTVYGFLHMAQVHTGPGPRCAFHFMQLYYVWFTELLFFCGRRAPLQIFEKSVKVVQ